MTDRPPVATVRAEVVVPIRLADGDGTLARILTFDGLVDGREQPAVGLGERLAAVPDA